MSPEIVRGYERMARELWHYIRDFKPEGKEPLHFNTLNFPDLGKNEAEDIYGFFREGNLRERLSDYRGRPVFWPDSLERTVLITDPRMVEAVEDFFEQGKYKAALKDVEKDRGEEI